MDIRGNLAYLSISEQIKSGLPSPIRFDEIDVLMSFRISRGMYHEAREAVHADHSEGLPHERANALHRESTYGARTEIYKKIVSEQITRGVIDARAIEDIR